MIPTSKFKCPMCKNDIYVNMFDITREPYMMNDYYSFVCDECKVKLTITIEEFENHRIDE